MTPLDESGFYSSIGKPLPDTLIKLLNDEGMDVKPGEAGELCAKGPQVMSGYWNKPGATAQAMTDDGFFKTGDIAEIGDDGRLRIVDRKKDMILVSGFNVYPNEIEVEVAKLDGILEAACVGRPDKKTGEAVTLYVVKKDPKLTVGSVNEWCRKRLTAYKIPTEINFIGELPKSTVGKTLRRKLRVEGA